MDRLTSEEVQKTDRGIFAPFLPRFAPFCPVSASKSSPFFPVFCQKRLKNTGRLENPNSLSIRYFLKMKKTAPQRQSAAQTKSRRNFSPMKNTENGTKTESVMTSCMIFSWASVSVV